MRFKRDIRTGRPRGRQLTRCKGGVNRVRAASTSPTPERSGSPVVPDRPSLLGLLSLNTHGRHYKGKECSTCRVTVDSAIVDCPSYAGCVLNNCGHFSCKDCVFRNCSNIGPGGGVYVGPQGTQILINPTFEQCSGGRIEHAESHARPPTHKPGFGDGCYCEKADAADCVGCACKKGDAGNAPGWYCDSDSDSNSNSAAPCGVPACEPSDAGNCLDVDSALYRGAPENRLGTNRHSGNCTHIRLRLGDVCLVSNMTAHDPASLEGFPVHLGPCNGVAGSADSPVWTAFEFNALKAFGSKDGVAEEQGCLHGGGEGDGPLYPGAPVPMEYCGSALYGKNIRFEFPPPNCTQLTFNPFPASRCASRCATVDRDGTLVVAHSCSATDAATFEIELC